MVRVTLGCQEHFGKFINCTSITLKNEDGRCKHSRTSLRSNFSMIKKYFKLVHLIDLEGGMPQILDRLKEYEEAQPV